VYIGNFGAQLFAVGHEIIRQRIRDLHVIVGSGGILLDELLGAGVVREMTFSHCWGVVGPSPAWNLRRIAEGGFKDVETHELTLGLLSAGLTAAAWEVPFMPVPDLSGTGYVEEDWTRGFLSRAESAFGGSLIVKAIRPDVAFVHVDKGDALGNGVTLAPWGETLLAANAARETVVVAEEVVPPEEVRGAGGGSFPGILASAVVEEPFGLHPDGAVGRYDRDVVTYESYARASSTPEGFDEWLRTWVLDVPDRRRYRAAVEQASRRSERG
jgi:glutaconate CoA-transferase subunit A